MSSHKKSTMSSGIFFMPNSLTGDTYEVKGNSLGYGLTKDQELSLEQEIQQENMDKKQHMNHLTQQMGLLASEMNHKLIIHCTLYVCSVHQTLDILIFSTILD